LSFHKDSRYVASPRLCLVNDEIIFLSGNMNSRQRLGERFLECI
jgi:hypothetical protein